MMFVYQSDSFLCVFMLVFIFAFSSEAERCLGTRHTHQFLLYTVHSSNGFLTEILTLFFFCYSRNHICNVRKSHQATRFLIVYGGGELCHIQPSNLRLLRVSSMGKHGGVVSGHVLNDPGASLRHLQAVHAAWKVLRCKSELRRLGINGALSWKRHFIKDLILFDISILMIWEKKM